MRVDDLGLLARWDDDPDVAAALGGRGADWYDWPAELVRDVPWRELLIAEEDGRPIGSCSSSTLARKNRIIGVTWIPGRGRWTSGSGRQGTGVAASGHRRCERQLPRLQAARRPCGSDRPEGHESAGDRFYGRLGFERVGQRRSSPVIVAWSCASPAHQTRDLARPTRAP